MAPKRSTRTASKKATSPQANGERKRATATRASTSRSKGKPKTPSPEPKSDVDMADGPESMDLASSQPGSSQANSPSRPETGDRGRVLDKGKGRGPQEPSPPQKAPVGAAPKPSRGAVVYNEIPERSGVRGQVFALGTGDFGELGLGETTVRKRPMPIKSLENENIVDVAVGGMHTLVLTDKGEIYSWGVNDAKALGRDGDETEPDKVQGLEGIKIVRIAAGDSISAAVTEEGRLYMWGSFRSGQGLLGFNKDNRGTQALPCLINHFLNVTIVDVAAGVDHVLALTATGDVWAWGNGEQYQLGRRLISRRTHSGLTPIKLALKRIVKIGCGAYHSFAVSKEGCVYSWGLNNFQQCGLEIDAGRREPIITHPTIISHEGLLGHRIKQCIGGNHFSLILREDGTLFAFGRSDENQLGLPYKVDPNDPYSVTDGETASQQSQQGPASDGAQSKKKTAVGTPTPVPNLRNVESVGCGAVHSLAVAGGDAYAWGFGENYALGNNEQMDNEHPEPIEGQKIVDHRILKADGGGSFTVLLARPSAWDNAASGGDAMEMD